MPKNKVAILTTIFPMEDSYLRDFFKSLQSQTYKKFDVVVLNDGCDKFGKLKLDYPDLKFIEIKYRNTPAKNREYAINFVKDNGYEMVVFADSDDYIANNRVNKIVELLHDNDIVVNDLSLFCGEGIYSENYLSNRIENNRSIFISDIREQNFFGLSNTALRVEILCDVTFNKNLIAVDWYLYSVLLMNHKRAVFTNETVTYYRQYPDNTVGLGKVTEESVRREIEIKKMHYLCLSELDETFEDLLVKIKKYTFNTASLDKFNQLVEYPFWWEFTQYIGYENENN
jgi:glycosyltransferase involved in cell wall biosynthesis